MNSKERVLARINSQPVDRIPNLNILMFFAAKEIGVSYSEYCQNYRKLAQGNIVCMQKYGIDAVSTISDPMRECADMGMNVVFPTDEVPHESELLIKEKSDLLKVKPVAVENGRRMTDRIKGTELLKREVGNDFAVIGWVEGCFAMSADLRGVNNFLMDIYEDREFVVDLLEICLEQATLFAKAQIAAGADIIGVGDAIASVAGPNAYQDLALQYEERLLKVIKDAGGMTKLHICGNITPFLEQLPVQYCDIIDIDWMVPLDKAGELYGDITCLNGNYDPVSVLLQGSVRMVKDSVKRCVKEGGAKHTSSGGCEVPKFTPPCNLMAVYEALKEIQ
ncbi:MAG: uroporphyrinogen decarboxylase family protein [Bacteroidales bacterium]|jgi:uroporphyrinogen decarboxylase|nr:uroporphyrinogen decarboxylase family protein [Bacteroidales bacterium]